MLTEYGVHPSLYPKCHHQIIFVKLNLKVEYPPLYECLIWDKKADIPSINLSTFIYDWGKSFEGKSINEQVCFLNIFYNYIPD